ncbi:MAG TPA: molybdenum ABC transporter ATP-binding protein [Steroidobacteraceae bacterium]|nr:molybdenum ABC transporter ATP-binding protein [Steroidobacteraceae bacterium]HQX77656.1 molybdenum ABC transporter ATP-binding protein [Steroidobacteraceae bacterium]HQZ79305.1 molybdenum ABC transporter ATP-binding protein [Steroidobacteraceae bacterium]
MIHVDVAMRRGDFSLDARFETPEAGVVALFGRSGCGKTTLVNLISGLLRPERGRIDIGGETLLDTASGRSLAPERRRVGYVFQDARLFPHLTVAENLAFGLRRVRGRPHIIEYDDVVALLALAPLVDRRPHSLSGGERQRVGLGRALLAQPRLLLLDEPLASLDVARREEVLPYLEALRLRLALPMIYVSHAFDEVLRLATHLVVLEAGRVVAQGSLTDVSLDPALTAIVGPAAAGAVLDAQVLEGDAATGLTRVRVGRSGELRLRAPNLPSGSQVRVQVLARDVILSDRAPVGLSVRNALRGHIVSIDPHGDEACRTLIDLDGARIVAHVTRDAVSALQLRPGGEVWTLMKAVSLRSHAFPHA